MSASIVVTDETFSEIVMNSRLPVVVYFGAAWYPPCREMDRLMDKIAGEQAGRLVVAKVNTDQEQGLMIACQVFRIPTTWFVMNGKVLHKAVDALGEEELRRVVEKFLRGVRSMEEWDSKEFPS